MIKSDTKLLSRRELEYARLALIVCVLLLSEIRASMHDTPVMWHKHTRISDHVIHIIQKLQFPKYYLVRRLWVSDVDTQGISLIEFKH